METKVTIDELKALQPLMRELETTENQLATFRDYEGDVMITAVRWQPPPPPHGAPMPARSNHAHFKNSEIIDTVVDIL
jgi:hypothetical protein